LGRNGFVSVDRGVIFALLNFLPLHFSDEGRDPAHRFITSWAARLEIIE